MDNRYTGLSFRKFVFITTFLTLALLSFNFVGHTQVSLTTLGSAYAQNFNTLANTGTSSSLPTGWYLWETGSTAANTTYAAGTGSDNAGNTYSFGAAAAADRAFGTLQSGSVIPTIGAAFANNTGASINSLDISYVGEMWRLGTADLNDDRLDFQYSLDATSLTTGTWIDVNALDFASLTQTTVGAKDGNTLNASISTTIMSLSIPNGTTFWIRWNDLNVTGSDDGLAVDDFSLTPMGAPVNPNLSINDVSLSEGNSGTTNFVFTVSLSAPAGPGGVTFNIATVDGMATTGDNDYTLKSLTGEAIPQGSDFYIFTVEVNGDLTIEADEAFFVNVTNIVGANAEDAQGLGTIRNDDLTVPTFTQLGPYCVGDTPDPLPGTSENSITGTWDPATISTVSPGTTTYTFTPDAGQGASTTTMDITVNPNPTLTLTALSVSSANCGDMVSVEIGVNNTFEDIGSLQFSVNWDPAQLEYVSNTALPIGGGAPVLGEVDVATGDFTYSWVDPAGFDGEDLANATVILTLNFKVKSESGTASVNVTGTPTPMEVGNSSFCTATPTADNFVLIALGNTTVLIGDDEVCIDSDITLTGSGTPAATNPYTSSNPLVATVDDSGVVTGLTAGSTTITYTNDNGCTATKEITVSECTVCSATLTRQPGTLCVGEEGALKINISAGTGNYTIAIDTDGNLATAEITDNDYEDGTDILVSPTSTTTYTLISVIDNGNSNQVCNLGGPQTITVVSPPKAGTGSSTNACNKLGTVITLADLLSGEDSGGTWGIQGGTPGNNFDALAGTLDPNGLAAGSYVFRYTVVGTAPCENDIEDVTVKIVQAPYAGSGLSINACEDTPTITLANLLSEEDANGTWKLDVGSDDPGANFNAGAGTLNPSGLAVGTYFFRYTVEGNEPCNDDFENVTVNIVALPNPGTISGDFSICVGTTTTLSSNGQGGGTWFSDNTLVAKVNSAGLVMGMASGSVNISYTVTGLGGCSRSASIPFMVNPKPVVEDPDDQIVCDGESVPELVLGFVASTYDWTNNTTSIGLGAGGNGNVPAFVANNDGNTPVIATITVTETENGCTSDPQTYTITVNPKVEPTFTQLGPYCQGETPSALPPTSNNNIPGNWSPTTINTQLLGTTTYNFFVQEGQCADSTNMKIVVNPPVTVEAGTPQTLCINQVLDLSELNASISGGATTGTWSSNGTGSFTGGTAFGTATAYVPSTEDKAAGTITLTLTSADPAGPCPARTDTVVITIRNLNCSTFPWNGGK